MVINGGKIKIEKYKSADFNFEKMQIEDFLYKKNLYLSLFMGYS